MPTTLQRFDLWGKWPFTGINEKQGTYIEPAEEEIREWIKNDSAKSADIERSMAAFRGSYIIRDMLFYMYKTGWHPGRFYDEFEENLPINEHNIRCSNLVRMEIAGAFGVRTYSYFRGDLPRAENHYSFDVQARDPQSIVSFIARM